LKVVIINAPLLHRPNYHRDYFLYLAATSSAIAMVLVQYDDEGHEHVIYYLSRNLLNTETHYAHVNKLALAVVQHFWHYILFHTTTVISNCNPMTYILTHQLLGSTYSKWIVILEEFDLAFTTAKSKKSLVFADLIFSFPSTSPPPGTGKQLPDDTLFLISTLDPWYDDIIVYLKTSTFWFVLSKDDHRHTWRQSQPYCIIGHTLYHVGVDSILRRCFTLDEAESILNN